MALIHCDFFSETLELCSSMYVILPQFMPAAGKDGKHETVFLLHGLSDDHSIWLRRTSIERYADALGVAVVMPAVHRSYYTDMAAGHRYWTYISEEVPAVARSFFPLSGAREDTIAVGLSMGGYGAFKLAFRCPSRFAAAASLSGALDIVGLAESSDRLVRREMERVFGPIDQIAGSDNDLMALAEAFARQDGPKPALYQCCGTDDLLYSFNVTFRDHARQRGLDLHYTEGPGEHEWGYWDRQIQDVLAWLPIRKPRLGAG
jgi:S-formylglutathione hydrolase FrmB